MNIEAFGPIYPIARHWDQMEVLKKGARSSKSKNTAQIDIEALGSLSSKHSRFRLRAYERLA